MVTTKTLQFLDDLKKNNNRDWFQAHQDRYADFKKEYRSLTEAFIEEMSKADESLKHLEFRDCSFRINRDVRFSKDKAPYKTNMGIWMSPGRKDWNLAGYYIHIEKGQSFIAGGIYWPEASELKKVRREISNFYEDLEEILEDKEFKKLFGSLERNEKNALKTAPKDFDKSHPAIEYLKLKSFVATAYLDDKLLTDKNFVKEVSKKLAMLRPLNEFINRALTIDE